MRLIDALIRLITGRRTKWLVLLLWVAVAAASLPLAGRLDSATRNDQASFLPADSESAQVLAIQEQFPGSDVIPALIIFQRVGGLTPADQAEIQAAAGRIQALGIEAAQGVFPGPPSPDGQTAILAVPLQASGDIEGLRASAEAIRHAVGRGEGGLQIRVSGPAGFLADTVKVFANINTQLLIASLIVVGILLLITYRSPFLWLLPLISVGLFADTPARALTYVAAEWGLPVSGQVAGITIVLVFGAGTDYALLLIARYREELRRVLDRHEAMARALRQAGPAILASGSTTILALLTLIAASLENTRGLGPVAAIGIAWAIAAMLTGLPALVLAFPRWVFWPLVPAYGSPSVEETGFWARLGQRLFGTSVTRRPRLVGLATAAVLAVMALGLVSVDTNLSQLDIYRGSVESVEGQRLLERSYPQGLAAPTDVVVAAGREEQALAAAAATPGVAEVLTPTVRTEGSLSTFQVVLADEPYSKAAWDTVAALRSDLREAAGGEALVGGASAQSYDVNRASVRDFLVVAPLALLVVLLILGLLLRSMVAPLMLVATVILSFAAALGLSVVVFQQVFGYQAIDASTPLLAFVFLVALGIDYNIFLMARVREEAFRLGTQVGMLRALAVTGGVITSAGLVLVGTFSVLAVLPLVVLFQFGFIVAFGVLLDTFVVRTVLVPALTLSLGSKVWWPSALSRGPECAPSEDGGGDDEGGGRRTGDREEATLGTPAVGPAHPARPHLS
jgi:putative drug exporter of the RND superfamily